MEQSRRLDLLEQKACFETQRGTSENPTRPASSADLSYFPVHLNISKHFSWGQDTPFLLTLAILLPPSPFARNSQPFSVNGFRLLPAEPWVSEVHARCLLLEYPRYCSRRWHVKILPLCSTETRNSGSLSRPITHSISHVLEVGMILQPFSISY